VTRPRSAPATSGTGDPVADLIVEGRASTVAEAEELYLDEHLADLVALVESDLSDHEFRRHPLVALLLARGSRRWEDALL
jgi:hypothetical protein